MFHLMRAGLALAALANFPTLAKASGLYTITDLGTLPGTSQSYATGINDLGQVVGYSTNGQSGSPQPWVYSNGQLTSATPIGGGIPNSINDSGQVVGGPYVAINNSGQYVEQLDSPSTTGYSSVLFSGGKATSLGNFYATAINDAGVIGGMAYNPTTGGYDPALYQNGQVTDLAKSLGLNTLNGRVVALDNSGDTYFYYLNSKNNNLVQYMLLKSNGQLVPMNYFAAMNNSLQFVVNESLFQNNQSTNLFSLLPPSSASTWQELGATAINNAGQIVGIGILADGETHSFLMTPLATPEPSTLTLLVMGIAILAGGSVARRSSKA